MRCPLCGYQFCEEEAQITCKGCPLARSCRMVRCPNCAYEVPQEPRLIKAIRAWRRRNHVTKRKR